MTEVIGKPVVEGLSEMAWARIERSVFNRLDSGDAVRAVTSLDEHRARRAWRWIALPVAVAAAIALVLVMTHRPEMLVDGPSRVVSGDAPSMVSFADAHVSLDANSAVVLEHEGVNPTVLLEHGAAWFSVAPRHERPAFVVLAGDATVRVIGTRFHVAREGERVAIAVDHGVVEVAFRGNVARVADGQSWSSDPGLPPAAETQAPRPSMSLPTRPTPPAVPHHATAPHTAPTADGDEKQFYALQAIETRQPALALAGYLSLSKGSGKWAAHALYSAALLSQNDNPGAARTYAEIYLKRFPNGLNALDAQRLIDSLQGRVP